MGRPLILWVEDNADDVLLLRQAFAEEGLDVEFIVPANAVQAFHYLLGREPYRASRRPPDLILVDLNLPVIPGTSVLQEIKKHGSWKGIPTVVFTSSTNPRELVECRSLGAIDCVTKPSSFDGYRATVRVLRRYLPSSGGHPTSSGATPLDPSDPAPGSDRIDMRRITHLV
jgi:CheY-like chemotaxis protein